MQHDQVLKKLILTFWPQPQGWVGVGGGRQAKYVCYHVSAFVILFNLVCNLTMFWKSWILTFDPRVRGWQWAGLPWQNICYHVAAFIFPFNVICNMVMFRKSWILTFWPHPLSPPRGSGTGLWSKIAFDLFLIYCNSVCMRNFCKK